MRIDLNTIVEEDLEDVWRRFDRRLFDKLSAPWMPVTVERFDGLGEGDELHLKLGQGPVGLRWVSRIEDVRHQPSEISYVDLGISLPLPLRSWRHKHRLLKRPGGGSLIRDEIEYSTGSSLVDASIYGVIYAQFAWRQPVYRREFGGL